MRNDLNFLVHGHSEDVMAVASIETGLLPEASKTVLFLNLRRSPAKPREAFSRQQGHCNLRRCRFSVLKLGIVALLG